MKCPKCGIEMQKKTAAVWECRNPKCSKGDKRLPRYNEKEEK